VGLQQSGRSAVAGSFAVGSVLVMIFVGELLPKSVAVIRPPVLAATLAVPLQVLVRLLDPLLPAFRLTMLLSRRLIWPKFQPEPYLRVSDLERAVRLSTSDAAVVEQEQKVLESIVSLSEIRADELMRPRLQLRVFRPPVALADLGGQLPASGYLLITEPDSDEVARAVSLRNLWRVPAEHLEQLADPVAYVPWSTTVAQAVEVMHRQQRRVAAVVNELGETIGILLLEDVVDTIFGDTPSRSERLFKRLPIRQVATGVWHVTGMTSIRRLVRHFHLQEPPPTQSITVSGVVQEVLQRMPQAGDQCRWGPFQLKVLDVPQRGRLLVELTMAEEVPP
jgi:putative hemolysin